MFEPPVIRDLRSERNARLTSPQVVTFHLNGSKGAEGNSNMLVDRKSAYRGEKALLTSLPQELLPGDSLR